MLGLQKIFVWVTASLMALSFSLIGWMFLGILIVIQMGSPDEVKTSFSTVLCGTYWLIAIIMSLTPG